jgi:NitT/TauT family transport system permease protein
MSRIPGTSSDIPPRTKTVVAGSVVAVALAIGAWQVASMLTFVIPSPGETFAVIGSDWTDQRYLYAAQTTFLRILAGLAIGVAIGILGGFVLGVSALARASLQSFVMSMYAIPKILLYPLIIPLFTIGSPSKIFMAVISATFPVMVMVGAAIADVPPIYTKLARSLLVNRWQYLGKILLPATARAVVTAVRVATSFAVLGVILAEFFAADVGLGRSLFQSYNVGDYDEVFATVLTLLVITFTVSLGLWAIEKRLDR